MITNYTIRGRTVISMVVRNFPSLYDDVYMDSTFVEVFDRLGSMPGGFHRDGFRNGRIPPVARKPGARYNILNGIMPRVGTLAQQPHADDSTSRSKPISQTDESGMPNSASEISEAWTYHVLRRRRWYGGAGVGR